MAFIPGGLVWCAHRKWFLPATSYTARLSDSSLPAWSRSPRCLPNLSAQNNTGVVTSAADRDSMLFPRKSNTPEAQAARQAQDAFEQTHRQGLRFYNGGADASCEELIGRICYWNNNGDVPPPAERSDARVERTQLISILERAVAASPGDEWLVSMLVRYDIEADRPDSALKARTRLRR